MKIGSRNKRVLEIRVKVVVFGWGEGNHFWFDLLEGLNNRRLEK